MVKIIFFIGRMAAGGGAEKVMAMLANHFVDKGWDVDIVLLLGNEVDKNHHQLDERINIIDYSPSQNCSYLINLFRWVIHIRRLVKKQQPDLMVSFFGRINALVLTSTLGLNIPIIVSERNDPRHDNRGKVMLNYCNLIYRRARTIVYQTKYEQSCFSSVHLSKSHIIPNPIKLVDIYNAKIDKNLIINVGRLQKHKNQEMLINAVRLVKERVPSVKCQIFGEGITHDYLQGLIDDCKLQDTVTLEGKKGNILDYVSSGYVFVTTSNYEGLSNALMEAMMLGKICITTDYEGADDLIDNGINGIIVPRNDVMRLSKVLIDILSDTTGKYSVLGENARKTMMKYESSEIMSKWDKLINKIVQ